MIDFNAKGFKEGNKKWHRMQKEMVIINEKVFLQVISFRFFFSINAVPLIKLLAALIAFKS